LLATCLAYAWLSRSRVYYAIAIVSLASWFGYSGLQSYQQLRRVLTGLDQIFWGMLFFMIATAISLRKAGIWPRSRPRWLAGLLGMLKELSWVEWGTAASTDAIET
jgi:hypothetical protein